MRLGPEARNNSQCTAWAKTGSEGNDACVTHLRGLLWWMHFAQNCQVGVQSAVWALWAGSLFGVCILPGERTSLTAGGRATERHYRFSNWCLMAQLLRLRARVCIINFHDCSRWIDNVVWIIVTTQPLLIADWRYVSDWVRNCAVNHYLRLVPRGPAWNDNKKFLIFLLRDYSLPFFMVVKIFDALELCWHPGR